MRRRFLAQHAALAGKLSASAVTLAGKCSHLLALISLSLLKLWNTYVQELTYCGVCWSGGKEESGGLQAWLLALVQEVTLSFGEQVSALIDTVKQMDSTLQRRSKLQAQAAGAAAGSANMTDSEKIALQIKLDIEAYGKEIASIELDPSSVPAFVSLRDLSIESN